MLSKLRWVFITLVATSIFVACFSADPPSAPSDPAIWPQVQCNETGCSSINEDKSFSYCPADGSACMLCDAAAVCQAPDPLIPVVVEPVLSSIPTTSSQVVASSAAVSSAVVVSSSSEAVVFVPVCTRKSTALEFNFVLNALKLPGHQKGSYGTAGISSGSLITTQGGACEDAQEVVAPDVGDDWNIYLKSPWTGRTGQRITIDVITWSSEPSTGNGNSSTTQVSSSSVALPDAVAGWFTESDYKRAFPNRKPFYTWASFVEAYNELQDITIGGTFKKFLNEGTADQKRREAAAFFANIVQETGRGTWNTGLYHIVETCADNGVPSGNCLHYGAAAPNYYYGRGPMQLSWDYNYRKFSEAIFGNGNELLLNPDLVHQDPKIAWLAAMWFWNRIDTSWSISPPTVHDIMVNGAVFSGTSGFGATIKLINGGIECPSSWQSQALARIQFYADFQSALNVPADTQNLHCF